MKMFYSRHKYCFSSGTTCLFTLFVIKWINFHFINCQGLGLSRYHATSNYTSTNQSASDAGIDTGYYVGYTSNPWGPSTLIDSSSQSSSTSPTTLASPTSSVAHRRSKRGVFDLYNMVFCATGCDPLAFKGYGCYCGFLGSGYTVDGIDRCCKMHDWCYSTANCPMYLEYFIPYLWKCYRRIPLCAIEQDGWGHTGLCAKRLCECDRHLAQCLRRYPCPTTKAVCTSSPWRLLQNIFML